MNIFFSGGVAGEWRSGWQRCQCLKELGHSVVTFDQEPYLSGALLRKPVRMVTGRFYDQKIVDEFNRDFLQAFVDARPDVAWVEWPYLLKRETLERAAARHRKCI